MTVHERKSFYKEQGRFYIDDMTLLELSLHLTTLIEEYGRNARIDYTPEPYDDGYYYAITALVPETDEEMQTRIIAENRRAKLIEENEKRQLAMLLAKHGVPDANNHTAKLQQLISAYVNDCIELHFVLGASSGCDEEHPLWVAMKESQRAMNNEIAALNIEITRLKMHNADLRGFVANYIKAWEDVDDGDMYMFSTAVKLTTNKGDTYE